MSHRVYCWIHRHLGVRGDREARGYPPLMERKTALGYWGRKRSREGEVGTMNIQMGISPRYVNSKVHTKRGVIIRQSRFLWYGLIITVAISAVVYVLELFEVCFKLFKLFSFSIKMIAKVGVRKESKHWIRFTKEVLSYKIKCQSTRRILHLMW